MTHNIGLWIGEWMGKGVWIIPAISVVIVVLSAVLLYKLIKRSGWNVHWWS